MSYSVHHRAKEVNWPLWTILGVLGLGVVLMAWSAMRPSAPAPAATSRETPAKRVVVGDGAPVNPRTLSLDACYSLSAETPMCPESGWVQAYGITRLPPDAQIGVIAVRDYSAARWYRVQAVAPDGLTHLGTGWISSAELDNQTLKLLR